MKIPQYCIFGFSFILLLSLVCYGQEKVRKIEKKVMKNEPIELVSAEVGNKTFNSENQILASKDWLKNLKLNVKNTSGKTIVFIKVVLEIEAQGEMQYPLMLSLIFGRRPLTKPKPLTDSDTEKVKVLKPQESVSLSIAAYQIDSATKFTEENEIEDIERAKIYFDSVHFDDDTAWSQGQQMQRNPDNERRMDVIINSSPKETSFLRKFMGGWWGVTSHPYFFAYVKKEQLQKVELENPEAICYWRLSQTFDICNSVCLSPCILLEDFLTNQRPSDPTIPSGIEVPANVYCEPQECSCSGTAIFTIVWQAQSCPLLPPAWGGCNQQPPCAQGFVVGSDGLCTRSNQFQQRCAEPSGYEPETCTCPDGIDNSPIIIDVDGSGFSLTSAVNGVDFDIQDFGYPQHLSWTASVSTNAFLVLDLNGNGTIDNGKELFGNVTPQQDPPPGERRNGFRALAKYDKTQQGGNNDGWIDTNDSIFSSLRLWQDTNHNGISEQSELFTLPSKGIVRLDLNYRESRRTDAHGNQFKYRAKVRDARGTQAGRWAWDVFLVEQP